MARLVLRPRREARLRAGHVWIYRSDVAGLDGSWRPDEAVTVYDAAGHLLGRGFYNPRPQIVCRLLTRLDEPVDAVLFRRRLEAAWRFRHSLGSDGDAGRVVFSEGDGLPGLIVDRYADVLVLQALTLGIHHHAPALAALALDVTGARAVYRRADPVAATIEGFAEASGWLAGEAGTAVEVEIREGPCRFRVDLATGHKTGFYLDQRENRAAVGALAAGRAVLDAFCYTGAFACWALRAGATRVVGVEASADIAARARAHAEANGGADRFTLIEGNAFDVLRDLARDAARFDLVVLDPPSFTRRKTAVEAALRGYKEINLRALACLRPGGLLATFSCSHHVSPGLFEEVCRAAAGDVGRTVRLRATCLQARDHPIALTVPETRYLKGLVLEAVD
ncbi:MAG TPA: class I SAM-dependent rRNA methyltransferase [Methylomirabilota bacterium]|jgi:23S rRNA (cytosine1962-C5)-methyltransferase|nr:class I SAM-dependent rRNA methyltransferase [Methylomirabilota bacterium]